MGFFDRLGKSIKSGEAFDRLAAARAITDGDYAGAARFRAAGADRKAEQLKAEQAQAQQMAVRQSLKAQGYNDDQINVIMVNPGEFSKRYVEQFGTNTVSPGAAVAVGGPKGVQEAYRAPVTPTDTEREYQFFQGLGPDKAAQYVENKLAPPRQGENERLIEAWNALPKDDPRRPMIERAIRGAQYDPNVYRPMVDYRTQRQIDVKTTAPGRNPPMKGGGGRGGAKPAKLPTGFILD